MIHFGSMSIIAIFGIEEQLGALVAGELSKVAERRLRIFVSGLPTNPESERIIQQLKTQTTVEFVNLSANAPDLKDVDACFLVTSTDFKENFCKEKEVAFGKQVANACKTHQVKYLVYLTSASPSKVLGIAARHMDSKAEIEEHIRRCGIPTTFIMLPTFYESLFDIFKPKKNAENSYRLGEYSRV